MTRRDGDENEAQALARADITQKDKSGEASKVAIAIYDLAAKFRG